ncbi:hypothetical protein QR685DRAFT_55019 [Neurospora intermedia]|uniref:Uncharacterized protein n=1 Tax=Neurospora intermedia TaxID=5142 RepID=A0ABR3DSL3_NEUIN
MRLASSSCSFSNSTFQRFKSGKLGFNNRTAETRQAHLFGTLHRSNQHYTKPESRQYRDLLQSPCLPFIYQS